MSWLGKQELLKKAKEKYNKGGKEKAAKYYKDNKKNWKDSIQGIGTMN